MAKQIGKYEIGRPLGEGQFGKVKECVDLETGLRYAVKIIRKSAIKSAKDVETVKKEVQFMKMLDHPNILRMFDTLEDSEKLYLVLEIAAGGDLFDKIVAMGGFTEETARVFFTQIVEGLEHCHNKNIIHRDLKPENLLLGPNDQLKISDFGLSNIIMSPTQMLKTHCGSEKYAAPEIMQNTDPYMGKPIDVWSCGVILYIMVGGAFPFVEATMNDDLYVSLVNSQFEFPKHFSPELIDLLLKMWTTEPSQRITVPEMKKHKWLNPYVELEQGPTSMAIDEEPVYRTLEPDMMSMMSPAYIEEEPVYRSIDADSLAAATPMVVERYSSGECGFACKPTETFEAKGTPEQVLTRVAEMLTKKGAAVKVKEEKGQVKAEMAGRTGDPVKVRVLVKNEGGITRVAMKRMKGHALDYTEMHAHLRPELVGLCDAA